MVSLSEFGKKLLAADTKEDYDACLTHLMDKGPSQIDLEITSLSPLGGGTDELMQQFLSMILSGLAARSNFEACQAYLSLFLKTHADAVIESPEMRDTLDKIKEQQTLAWTELEEKLVASSTLVAFFKNSVIC